MEHEQVAFVFLSDGPVDEKTFRPREDATMHWARRDALVRITAQALYGGSSSACTHADILYHEDARDAGMPPDGNDNAAAAGVTGELLAVMAMHGPELRASAPVPTEHALLKVWKEAAAFAARHPQQAHIGASVPVARRPVLPGQKLAAVGPPPGVACSLAPWREAAFLRYAHAPSSSRGHPSLPAAAPAAAAASSSSGFDKRVVLRSLQQQCTLDFLRKHGLNGSEDLVLKKRNKEAILAAHREWTQGLGAGGAGGAGTGTEEGEGEDGGAARLRQTFEMLFCRHLAPPAPSSLSSSSSSSSRRRVTVLLLHEDYPQELPVFGTYGPFGGGLEEGSDSAGGQAGQAGHTVVCVLGAVRDTSDAEVAAAAAAAARVAVGMPSRGPGPGPGAPLCRCVGANLGRTAEFTSKIVAALVAHARCGRLGAAVDRLPALAPGRAVPKLAPARAGGVRWDGHANKRARTEAGATATATATAMATTAAAAAVVHFHAVLWVPYLAADVVVDAAAATGAGDGGPADRGGHRAVRGRLHTLVQAAVCTLWRSRVAHEAHEAPAPPPAAPATPTTAPSPTGEEEDEEGEGEGGAAGGAVVRPSLTVVFADGHRLTVTQAEVVGRMVARGRGAPSEHHVLSALQEIIADQGTGTQRGSARGEPGAVGVAAVVRALLPAGLGKARRRRVRVVDLCLIPAEKGSDADGIPALSDAAYAGTCTCAGAGGAGAEDAAEPFHLLLLLRPPPGAAAEAAVEAVEAAEVAAVLGAYRKKGSDALGPVAAAGSPGEEAKAPKGYARARLLPPGGEGDGSVSPGAAVAVLQHWAYHGRLWPAVDAAAKAHSKRMKKAR